LRHWKDEAVLDDVRREVAAICSRFPVPGIPNER
jgi:hypothetical protein